MKDVQEGELSVHALKEGYIQRAGSTRKGTRIELCFWYGGFRVQVIERSRRNDETVIEQQETREVKKARTTFRELVKRFNDDIVPQQKNQAV